MATRSSPGSCYAEAMRLDSDPHDPGFDAARQLLNDAATAAAAKPIRIDKGGDVRVGTASWTDPTMVARGLFYPDGASSAEERLRYYATQFAVVEVDATYYALPRKE